MFESTSAEEKFGFSHLVPQRTILKEGGNVGLSWGFHFDRGVIPTELTS